MIYMRIWEGLGNQMFQYAYARALQLRNCEEVCLCVLPDQTNRTIRQYKLNKLRIRLKCSNEFRNVAEIIERNECVKKLAHTFSSVIFGYIEEKNTQYNECLKHLKGNYYISGWFQNEKYFSDYEEIIRKELYPKQKIRISKKLRHILNSKNTVSVHIRRGDYRQLNNMLKTEYYSKALQYFDSHIEDAFYVVFSDDLNWVINHMYFGDNVYFMNSEYGLEDYEEMFIMSRCKHNIIANSTFSWWGAWLNSNSDKVVIGPERWFANSRLNIMPDKWIKM